MNQLKLRSFSWLDRLFFQNNNKFNKSDNVVHPCVIDGQEAIVYKKGLRERNPVFFAQLNQFAKENNIFLKEDQRDSFNKVKNDRRRKVMPMMVLGASLFSQAVTAATKSHDDHHDHSHHYSIQQQVDQESDYNAHQKQEINDLLNWVYAEVKSAGVKVTGEMPDVKKVNSKQMFKIAFGKDMPRAMSQKNMQIFGLYNYKNKTVYLLDSIDLNTEKGKSILLHELVHYVQYENDHDEKVSCKNKLEHLAYNLEAKYLKEHGQRVNFSSAHINRVSQCA